MTIDRPGQEPLMAADGGDELFGCECHAGDRLFRGPTNKVRLRKNEKTRSLCVPRRIIAGCAARSIPSYLALPAVSPK